MFRCRIPRIPSTISPAPLQSISRLGLISINTRQSSTRRSNAIRCWNTSPAVLTNLFESQNVLTRCYRYFSSDILHQKHLLKPSLIDKEAPSPTQSPVLKQLPFDETNPFQGTLNVNRELIRSGTRSCRHIEIDIAGSNMEYEAGDHIGIYAANDSELVQQLSQLCDGDLDTEVSDRRPHTFRSELMHHIELAAIPQSNVLKALAEHCNDESDRSFLELISSETPKGNELYKSWIVEPQRNIVHVLQGITSCRPPIDFVCRISPRLKPRYYSISSSSLLHPTVVHMTVVLVKYDTKLGKAKRGVASTFLAAKNPSATHSHVPVFIRRSQFHLPKSVETPIIMIGTGTGIAPFLGFMQERNYHRQNGAAVGQTLLYFGARKRSEDFIYENELNDYVQKGSLRMRTAFSRDQPEKIYVTQLMLHDADFIWRIIHKMGHIYVCGDARHMAHDVRNVLLNIIETKGEMSQSAAVQYLNEMESQKRYCADVWS